MIVWAAVKLQIESVPQSAIVRINGTRVGMTPLIFDTLAGQTLDLSIEHPDTISREQRITVARSPFRQSLRFALQYRQTYVQVVGPDIAGSYSISKSFRTTTLERGKQVQVDPGEYKVCFACFSKEQAKSTNCGESCCRKTTVLPGKLNIVSFHEELRSPTSVPDIREFSSDGVTERSAPAPATKAPAKPLFEISQSSVSAFMFDVGAEKIQIGKISTVLAKAHLFEFKTGGSGRLVFLRSARQNHPRTRHLSEVVHRSG
ncbi:MAG: hypothetical protein IPJ84_15180 [Bdellovibrionales bacterium]|nr:hypothetical protein [Bdellovibrionales bacterium]